MTSAVWDKRTFLRKILDKDDATVALVFEVPGDPKPYSPAKKGPFGWYDPRSPEKETARWYFRVQYSLPPIRKAVAVGFVFEMPIPKSWSKKKRKAAANGEMPHQTKPDIDNLIKLIADCMKGIVLRDDNQIAKLSPEPVKKYSEKPKTTIWVTEL
ncbi:hypothetical protein LCGC14_0456910 [marine sediment metagenome]|uniref:Uncharacterized protein n=1 Tax=marine sediment metagenome TaxID=412755 RepID=A0A0F9SLK0_9ZZZZ|nr:RusA family crossover junction endodeoxyribonuclease [Candidatus Aminicenantes bacterium]